jgi:hypothetical protein
MCKEEKKQKQSRKLIAQKLKGFQLAKMSVNNHG